ncbi:MAG TPA: efflux RND transporter periplasmic adaptor subunit [Bryobacteraceae bacterium]|nr:efflux RND transporter periplasmic adaptor subunit [Bryobacteraceae bacterium]
MKTFRVLLMLVAIAAAFVGGLYYERRRAPQVLTDASGRRVLYYVDPMHPAYTSDKPGIAPDCGMRLQPVYADGSDGRENVSSTRPADLSPGTIQVSPDRQQLIGVRYGVAEMTSGAGALRAVGKVALDETRISRLHSKIEGWIEKVNVDFVGAPVAAGQPLLTIYSPEMLASQQELLLAMKAREMTHDSTVREAYVNNEALIDAARKRLSLWDLSQAQIDQIQQTGQPIHSITLYAPAGGLVMERNAFPNQRVTPETQLYAIADLDRVWVMADVFETDLPKIRVGQAASITLPYTTARAVAATVNYVQPQVDPTTRTLKIRLEAANSGHDLKPDMFVNVDFRLGGPVRVTVPVDAVLDAGTHKTVFVDRGNGYLEPRAVETGDRSNERIEITRGLKAGERIVTSGTFLIDSESHLRSPGADAAMANMPGMDNPSKPPALPASKSPSPSKTGPIPTPGMDHSQMEHPHDQSDH